VAENAELLAARVRCGRRATLCSANLAANYCHSSTNNMDAPTTRLSDDERALFAAAIEGDLDQVRALLAKGVAVDPRNNKESWPLGMEWNITPLMCAAANGHVEVIRALLAAGANPNAASDANKVDGGPGATALHHALSRGHVAAAEALLDAGADPNAIGRYGRTPLTSLIMSLPAVRLILSRGGQTSPRTRRKDVDPPLYVAASAICNTGPMVSRNGKMVMAVEEVWARRDEVVEIFKLLLDAGADPNAPGPRGGTALARLAYCEEMPDELRFPVLEMLLKAGANPHQADKDGTTAIQWAQLRKNERVLTLLQEAPPSLPAAAPSPAPKDKRKSTSNTDGAADFHKLLSTGEQEWAVLAVTAPIDAVTDELERELHVKATRNAPIKPATKKTDHIPPAIAVVEVCESRWTVIFQSLLHLNETALAEATELARKLSAALKTRAILYLNHDAADAAGYTVFETGAPEQSVDEAEEDSADQFFRDQQIYLPACYPKASGKNLFLAVEKRSAGRIARADLIMRKRP
jgi:ankyrin repeat protein